MDEYRKLDTGKLKFVGTLSMEEALKDIEPFEWDDSVYDGSKKVIIDKQGIHYIDSEN